MNLRRTFLMALVALAPMTAQHGHPLVGTWHGAWRPAGGQEIDLTVVFAYDGKVISGMVNPGLDVMRFTGARLDVPTWGVRFEGDMKDAGGAMAHVVAEGKIQDIVNPRREIVGTWTQGARKGEFKLVRDN